MEIPKIDGFEILEKLGEGGMASVWKARQISLDRIVAIKVLSQHLATDEDDVNRFLKEACATAQLKHSGIVQVYDAKATKELYCFVMEYVAGYTVGDWVRRKGYLPEGDVLTVIDCIADAMGYAWNKARVIHCDIKPDNIIIDADGTVKVADLGLSHTLNAISVEMDGDEVVVMGTPAYISPEQAEGKNDLDCRSDIYSLGAMMYHMLTGKLMFHGEDDDTVMQMQLTDDPIDAQSINPEISTPVNELLKTMLSKKTEDRPQNWQEVRRLLSQVHRDVTGKYDGATAMSSVVTGGLNSIEQRDSKYKSDKTKKLLMFRTLAFFVAFVVVSLVTNRACQHGPDEQQTTTLPIAAVVAEPTAIAEASVEPESSVIDDNAREMFEFAKERQRKYPSQISESIRAFTQVTLQTKGTKYSLMAEDEIKRLERMRDVKIDAVISALDEEARPYIDGERLLAAANVYELYSGVLHEETEDARKNTARLLREQHAKIRKDIQVSKQKSLKLIKQLMEKVPALILSEGVGSANSAVQSAMKNSALREYKEKLQEVSDILIEARNIDQYILASFKDQVGQNIQVNTLQGSYNLVIVDVDNFRVVGRQDINVGSGIASSEIIFRVADLTQRDKMSRMGSEDVKAVALVKGIMAYNSRAYGHAYRLFDTLDEPLAKGLLMAVESQVDTTSEQAACANLRLVLSSVGVDVTATYSKDSWRRTLRQASFSKDDIKNAKRLLDAYMTEYGDTAFASEAAPIIKDLRWMIQHKSKKRPRSKFVDDDHNADPPAKLDKKDLDLGWRKSRRVQRLLME